MARINETTGPLTINVNPSDPVASLMQIPRNVTHKVTVVFPSDNSLDGVDITLPHINGERLNPEIPNERQDGGNVVLISDGIAYAKIGGLMLQGPCSYSVQNIHTTKKHEHSDGSGIELRNSAKATLNGVKQDASNEPIGTIQPGVRKINRAVCAYEGCHFDIKGPYDCGENQFVNAFVAKRGSTVYAYGWDDTIQDINMTGIVDRIAWPQGGELFVQYRHGGNGSALVENAPGTEGSLGPVWEVDRTKPSQNVLRLKNGLIFKNTNIPIQPGQSFELDYDYAEDTTGCSIWVRCISAEKGFNVNDRVPLGCVDFTGGSNQVRGVSLAFRHKKIVGCFADPTNSFVTGSLSHGGPIALTNDNWVMEIYAS